MGKAVNMVRRREGAPETETHRTELGHQLRLETRLELEQLALAATRLQMAQQRRYSTGILCAFLGWPIAFLILLLLDGWRVCGFQLLDTDALFPVVGAITAGIFVAFRGALNHLFVRE
jgi:hypothetical protein